MYRNLFGILAVFGVAIVLVGLTFSAAAEKRADYVFVNGSEPKTLDPQKMTGQLEGRIADALFEGLTFHDNETLKPVPGMAARWEVSEDAKRWTFHLRPGVVWSNGDPVTARDFVYAWKRLQEPAIASEYAYLMHVVRHAEAYNTYGAQVLDLRGDPKAAEPALRQGIVRRLRDLLEKRPGGLPASEWQTFAGRPFGDAVEAAHAVTDAVTRTKSGVILDALARTSGTISPEEGKAIADALQAEADHRAGAHARALEHFGVDEGMFAPDDLTFVVELNAFTPYFLELTAFYVNFPVHRATVERWPEDWFTAGKIVSNGPFLMEAWEVNRKIRMRRNPRYWGAKEVSLETVDALPVENQTTALNLYLSGDVDWLPGTYPPDLIDQLKSRPDFYSSPGMVVYYYKFNCTKPPLDDPRVRLAIGLAFDRRVVVDELLRAGQVPSTTIVAPGVPGYESPASRYGYDVKKARALLAEAGYPEGRGFRKLGILYNNSEAHKKIAEWLAEELKNNLGIEANAVNQEWQSYQESVRRLNYDVARAGWIGDYRDPNTFLDMWITKGGNNQTGWGDPFYDRLIQLAADPLALGDMPAVERESLLARFKERGRAEELLLVLDAAKDAKARLDASLAVRLHLFREAEAILFQDGFPVMPVYFYVVSGLVKPEIVGFHAQVKDGGRLIPNLQDMHPFRDVRIRKDGAK